MTIDEHSNQKNSMIDSAIWGLTTFLFSAFLLFDMSIWASYILLGLSISIFVLHVIQNKGKLHVSLDRYHVQIIFFAFFCLVSALWAENPSDALSKGITIIEILICMSMLYVYYQTQLSVRGLIMSVKWGSFITSIYTFIYYGWVTIMEVLSQGDRLAGDYANINSIAMVAAIGLVIVSYQWLYEGFSFSYLFGIPSIIIVAASGSRKALVFALIGIILTFVMRYSTQNAIRNLIKYIAFFIGALLVFRIIGELPMFYGIMERMDGLFALITGKGTVDSSALKRLIFMKIAFEQIYYNPILGVGMDNAKYIIGEHTGIIVYSHNNFAELICDGGIIGFILYYSMHFYYLKYLIKYHRDSDSLTIICLALAIVLLIMDWGRVSYYSKLQYFFFMIFFLQVKYLRRESCGRNNRKQSPAVICQAKNE